MVETFRVTFTISSDDPRSIKAIEIAAGAGQWLKCRTRDGRKAFGVPSSGQPGRYYLVDCQSCSCPDFKRHGLSSARIGQQGTHHPCKHVLAVRLHCELSKAQEQAQAVGRRRGRLSVVRPTAAVNELAAKYDDIFKRFEGD